MQIGNHMEGLFVMVKLVVDTLYAALDPRISRA
jgi:ABC-type dipeptide/oligopeptide/nickel transport system permease component